jgi:hypothetical protein
MNKENNLNSYLTFTVPKDEVQQAQDFIERNKFAYDQSIRSVLFAVAVRLGIEKTKTEDFIQQHINTYKLFIAMNSRTGEVTIPIFRADDEFYTNVRKAISRQKMRQVFIPDELMKEIDPFAPYANLEEYIVRTLCPDVNVDEVFDLERQRPPLNFSKVEEKGKILEFKKKA